ncbi:MAG: M20/M25/M40 family metallo-hydrolase [Pirellulales bacterium]
MAEKSLNRPAHCSAVLLSLVLLTVAADALKVHGAENNNFATALNSIRVDQLQRHVETLADDALEGREAGTRGGRAAGLYLRNELRLYGLEGAAEGDGYFQIFSGRYRNVLGKIEGSDPELKHEFILIGAHYDHVGYGSRRNSFGPLGHIHNGADDNASGTSGLLEVIEAFSKLDRLPRRTVLFAFWDAEEKGLLGSKYYISRPDAPLNQTKAVLNVDMIGRLREDRLMVHGSRTAAGWRGLASRLNETDLTMDFTWELKGNSDHYPFFQRRIPVLMLHTGLHDDYHRPRDDAKKVNVDGIQRVSRLLFSIAYELANSDRSADFREQARKETPAQQKKLLAQQVVKLPKRLGVSWRPNEVLLNGLRITGVERNSPAQRSGLRGGDRIVLFDATAIADGGDLKAAVVAARNPVPIVVQREGSGEPVRINIRLVGRPYRLGISWRTDDAEPGVLILNRVVPGSPAQRAGLQLNDRIYEFEHRQIEHVDDFLQAARTRVGSLTLLVEREGRLHEVVVEDLPANNSGE